LVRPNAADIPRSVLSNPYSLSRRWKRYPPARKTDEKEVLRNVTGLNVEKRLTVFSLARFWGSQGVLNEIRVSFPHVSLRYLIREETVEESL
jgi:hypothetical protein